MPDVLYAHTRPDCPPDAWEPLARHLGEVAAMASTFAAAFGGDELARTLGLLHDLGKASARFQAYLRGEAPSTDHCDQKLNNTIALFAVSASNMAKAA